MKKLLCMAVSAVMMCTFMTGCGDKEDSSEQSDVSSGENMLGSFEDMAGANVNVDPENMPYGANVTELSHDYDEKITYKICYDSRFFERANSDNQDFTEMYRLHDFILALDNNDHELMESLYYPGYIDYICKESNLSGVDEYCDGLYSYVQSSLGQGFEINYIHVSNCFTPEDDVAASFFETTDDELRDFDKKIADKVTSKKLVEIGGDTCFRTADGVYLLTDYMTPFVLRIYEIDGETYLF